MTKKHIVMSKDVLISSGLHTLYIPNYNELFDLKVFVSVQKDLRYALKINRDIIKRGKSLKSVLDSLKKRENDTLNYIVTQEKNADLIINLSTTQKVILLDFFYFSYYF